MTQDPPENKTSTESFGVVLCAVRAPESFRIIPIEEQDLKGAAVLAQSVIDLELQVGEIKDSLRELRSVLNEQWEVLKAFSDLYTELTDESERRKWLDKRIKAAEREAARTRLGVWFWRKEPGMLKTALVTRASYLWEEGYIDDDIYDLLKEYLEHIGEERVTDRQLVNVVYFTRQNRRES